MILIGKKIEKKCKDDKLGIDFTLKFIVNIKDMKKHIKTVNGNYNIVDIFMHFSKDWKYHKKSKINKKSNENNQINVVNQINNINFNFPSNNNFVMNTPFNTINNNLLPIYNNYLNNNMITNQLLSLYLLNLNNNYINNLRQNLLYTNNNINYFNSNFNIGKINNIDNN